MTGSLGKQNLHSGAAVLSEIRDFVHEKRERHDGGIVEVDGQPIKYGLYSVDVRTDKTTGYPGEVVLLLGEQDSVIRWRDVLPACDQPGDIPAALPDFKAGNHRQAKSVEFAVVQGNHLAPEADSTTGMRGWRWTFWASLMSLQRAHRSQLPSQQVILGLARCECLQD
jgi:hypothetical protein